MSSERKKDKETHAHTHRHRRSFLLFHATAITHGARRLSLHVHTTHTYAHTHKTEENGTAKKTFPFLAPFNFWMSVVLNTHTHTPPSNIMYRRSLYAVAWPTAWATRQTDRQTHTYQDMDRFYIYYYVYV